MFYIFLISLLLSFVLNSSSVYLSRRVRIFSSRLEDGSYGVSRLGGVAIVLSFFIAVHFAARRFDFFVDEKSITLLAVLMFTSILGILDDLLNLSPFKKLMIQLLISIFLVVKGVKTEIAFLSPSANALLSIVWYVAIMNAFNFFDICDGLAAGISCLSAATFLYISYSVGNFSVGIFAAALLGSNLLFLKYNLSPARLYMGDTGSLFNGIAFAAIAIMISYAPPARAVAVFVPLFILALPLCDLMFVILMRVKAGRPIAQKSRDHFILRLIDKGMNPRRAVFLMYFFSLLFSLCGILLLFSFNLFAFSLLFFTLLAWIIASFRVSRVDT